MRTHTHTHSLCRIPLAEYAQCVRERAWFMGCLHWSRVSVWVERIRGEASAFTSISLCLCILAMINERSCTVCLFFNMLFGSQPDLLWWDAMLPVVLVSDVTVCGDVQGRTNFPSPLSLTLVLSACPVGQFRSASGGQCHACPGFSHAMVTGSPVCQCRPGYLRADSDTPDTPCTSK